MDDVTVSGADGVQVIRLTRPAKKNALTGAMYAAITQALLDGDADPAIAAHVLLGSGGVFSAGNDIADFIATSKGAGGLGQSTERFIRTLPLVAKPMIAGVDGPAVGVGTTLLFHCDLVYATQSATFSTPFLDLGLVPEAGSSLLMPMRMGYARAFEMLVLGETFAAERAREAGIVNAVVGVDLLEPMVIKAARRLAAKPPQALNMARRLMRGESGLILDRIDQEVAAFRERLVSPEAQEAFHAFLEKRKPDFSRSAGRNRDGSGG